MSDQSGTTQDRTFQILGAQLGDAAVRAAASQAYIETLEAMVTERDRRVRELEGELSDLANSARREASTGSPDAVENVFP